MNKKNRLLKIAIAAALSMLMAGSTAQAAATALGLTGAWMAAWLSALTAALLCALAAWSGPMALLAGVLGAVVGGGALAANTASIGALSDWLTSFASGETLDATSLSLAGGLFGAAMAALLCAVLFVLLTRRAGTPFALLVYFALLIACYAVADDMPLILAVPGLLAALSALALTGEVPRDGGAWRALVPVVLAVGAALLLTPSGRITWEPLERAAQNVRAAFEDYFRFTEERVPFTISTEGYNHAAEVDGAVVARLGGPADPDMTPVMRVTADHDVLLRGAVRRTYTGSTWVDGEAKARYLYYDFTRRSIRERALGMSGNESFEPVSVSVEILEEGASSLFVPARLGEFSMQLDTAVYFNSIGEMFLSRRVEPGDCYSLTGWQPDGDVIRAAVIAAQNSRDDDYAEMMDTCVGLPEGIEEGVYALAIELTRGLENPYDKARAIESWLRQNCTYTLTPDYPQPGRDFVSQFVLDAREGYCSYFATAMTVMCRIAGLPARYVEGYSVRDTGGEAALVTGENAHAWTEVYFNGVGWVSFDPSNGAGGGVDDGDTAGDTDSQEAPESGDPDQTPEPTLPPDSNASADDFPHDEPTPSPTPGDGFAGDPGASSPQPSDDPAGGQTGQENPRSWTWLWILLAVLLLLALIVLIALWMRSRLAAADPIRLSSRAKTARQAALILYRSILTLLAQTGQAPLNGETPGAFARRVCAQNVNPDFVAFADAVALNAYGRAAISRENVEQGRRAYAQFLKGLRRGERLRFAVARIFKGLGEFEAIP